MSGLSTIETLRQKYSDDLPERLSKLPDAELQALLYDWRSWARPEQLPPSARPWGNWLIKAGRGCGKTRTGSETLRQWISDGYKQCNIIVRTVGDIEKVLVKSKASVLNVCPDNERPIWTANKRLFSWPNGATSFVFTAEEPDSLRGPECEKLWCDEMASWRYDQDTWDMAQLGLRLGNNPQAIITTTPRPTPLIRALIADPNTVVTNGSTYDNMANLSDRFLDVITKKYKGTRLGRQEIEGEVLDDNPGALFQLSDIEGARVRKLPPLVRIVVAMDPATTSNEDSDEWGIVAAGQDGRDPAHFYILADESDIYTPDQAAQVAVRLYHRLAADRLVGEANNGGDMIEALIRHVDTNVAYKKVIASRGKVTRAEPVSALYEQHRVHHHGPFPDLETQMNQWNPKTDKDSPDRLDACFVAGTIIQLRRGETPIEDVRAGDEALTRRGWRKVKRAGLTNSSAETISAAGMRGTPSHRVWTENRGFIPLDSLVCGDTLLTWSKSFGFKESSIPATRKRAAYRVAGISWLRAALAFLRSIKQSGLQRMGQSLKGTIFITRTMTGRITNPQTWNALPRKNTHFAIGGNVPSSTVLIWNECDHWLPSGTAQQPVSLSTPNLESYRGKIGNATYHFNARDAAKMPSVLSSAMVSAIAAAAAIERRQTKSTDTKTALAARSAKSSSGVTSTEQSRRLARHSAGRKCASSEPVYNLEVEGEREYFANGVLVHNCVWAITELGAGSDGWAGFVKSEGQASPEAPRAPRINVAGGNRDRCECSSAAWISTPIGGQVCFKCGKPRPEA